METTDMPTNDVQQKRRPRRSAPKKSAAVEVPVYGFPTLDEILKLSDEQILESFKTIGVEPSPFRWDDSDDQAMVSRWHDYGMTMTDADRMKSVPSMKTLKATAQAIHNACLKTELLREYLSKWIDGLSDKQLISEVERLSEERMSVSEERYAKVTDLRERVQQMTWPVLIAASTLYVRPVNPLTGE